MFFVVGGCVTISKSETQYTELWNNRVGNYTYNDAVISFGPPDKSESLDNGPLVTVWMKTSLPKRSTSDKLWDVPKCWSLHLVFNKEKILIRWSKVTQLLPPK